MISRSKLTVSALMALCSFSVTAVAQQAASPPAEHASGNILEEVIVSAARRRAENVQSTPLAVTALDASLLEREHVTDITNIASLSPNLHIGRMLSTADAVVMFLRGFGARSNDPAVDPHIAMFVDGIYSPTISGTLVDMFDIQQVEVLGGPQGTLFGKNAPVGAISITTARPTGELGGSVQADFGRFDHTGIRAKLNFPIIKDILAGKISFVSKSGGNWIKDFNSGSRIYGGEHVKGGRLSLAFTPNDKFRWDLITSLSTQDNPQNALRNVINDGIVLGDVAAGIVAQPLAIPNVAAYCGAFYGGPCKDYPYGTSDIGNKARPHGQTTTIASNMSYQFSPVTVTAVAGYLKYFLHENTDVDGTPVAVLDAFNDQTRSEQKSIEVRVASNKGGGADFGGKFDWVLGAFYSNFDYYFDNNLIVFGVVPVYQQEIGTTKSSALFLHTIYHFTDEWSGSAGVRYSKDKKEHALRAPGTPPVFVPDPGASFSNTSFEAGVQWQFHPERMAYLRFAQGYQAGGFNGFASGLPPFQETKNDSIEIGLKSEWLDKRLRFNVNYFHYKLKDLQVQGVIPIAGPPGFLQFVANSGASKVQGVEMSLIAVPVDSFTANLTLGYLKPKYDSYVSSDCTVDGQGGPTFTPAECKNIPFPYSPKWTGNLGLDYNRYLANDWGKLDVSANLDFRSESFVSQPPFPSSRSGGYGLLNAQIGWKDSAEKYEIDLYGSNLTNKEYLSDYSDSGGLTLSRVDGRPREYGIKVMVNFGQK